MYLTFDYQVVFPQVEETFTITQIFVFPFVTPSVACPLGRYLGT